MVAGHPVVQEKVPQDEGEKLDVELDRELDSVHNSQFPGGKLLKPLIELEPRN